MKQPKLTEPNANKRDAMLRLKWLRKRLLNLKVKRFNGKWKSCNSLTLNSARSVNRHISSSTLNSTLGGIDFFSTCQKLINKNYMLWKTVTLKSLKTKDARWMKPSLSNLRDPLNYST